MSANENRRVALTKRLLKEGLLRLLEKKELAKINVTELCRESGVNRATFYKHYGCPDDVLADIKEQFLQELLELQQQDGDKDSITYIEGFGRICAFFYEHKKLTNHIFRYIDFNISDMLETLSQGRNGMYEYLEKNFDPDGAKLASAFIGYGAYSIVRQWLVDDIEKTPKEIEAIVHKLMNSELFQ